MFLCLGTMTVSTALKAITLFEIQIITYRIVIFRLNYAILSYEEGLPVKKNGKARPICGGDVAKNANICPHCGGNLTFRKPGVWVGLILWIAALFCMMKACGVF